MGDLNLESTEKSLNYFIARHESCVQYKSETYTDLILTNQQFSFKARGLLETELGDHHHLIYFIPYK